MNKFIQYIKEPWRMVVAFDRHVASIVPDKLFLKCLFRINFGKKLNLKNPQTFNEKLQWLKLYDRNPLYTILVNKYAVKEYVAKIIGEEHIIPTLGVWSKFDDINFDTLPDKFVLKCTHSSGDIVICKDKKTFDKAAAKKKLESFLKKDFYKNSREWPYKNVPRKIIAEKYMEDSNSHDLRDYKIYCFNGAAKAFSIITDRFASKSTKYDYFDTNFNHLPFSQGGPNSIVAPKVPEKMTEMIKFAEMLSKNIPQVRCDFYQINGQVYFGEMTFFDSSGFDRFNPEEWDYKFGEWITLPKKRK